MTLKLIAAIGVLLGARSLLAQTTSSATMRQLMVDLIHPASNEILLFVNRGEPHDEKNWAGVRRSALTIAESGTLLALRGRANDERWAKDARLLVDVGAAAYRAAQAKDAKTLASLTQPLDDACTTCHVHYRPNVFPGAEGQK